MRAYSASESPPPDSFDHLIAPFDADTFFDRYWQKQPLVIARNAPDHYARILGKNQIDFTIAAACRARNQTIDIMTGADSERAPRIVRDVDVGTAYQQFRSGATLRVNMADCYWQSLRGLCRQMEDRFAFPVSANLYCTPAGARGLQRHADTYGVLVLQIEGSKNWSVAASDRRDRQPADKLEIETVLAAGDLLYVPRGFLHEAWTGEQASAHLTIAFHAYSWADLIAAALRRIAGEDGELAVPLRPGLLPGEGPLTADTLRTMLALLGRSIDLESTCADMARNFVRTRWEPEDEALMGTNEVAPLDAGSELEVRPGAVSALYLNGDDVMITMRGRTAGTPKAALTALRFIRTARRFRVGDLPGGLSEADKLALAGRLMKLGYLRPAPQS